LGLITPRAALTPCILDDDLSQLELMTELVASAGFEAVATADPEEAPQLVRSGRSRLTLVDVHMPGMNGYEFLERAIKADPGVHVILMAGDYTLESALDAIRRGAADFARATSSFPAPSGNRLRAAQVLGIGRTSLYRYLKEDGYDQNVIARAKAAAG